MQQLEDYLAAWTTLKLSSPSVRLTPAEEKLRRAMEAQSLLMDYLSHVLYFGADGRSDYDITLPQNSKVAKLKSIKKQLAEEAEMDSPAGRLVVALKHKCGLNLLSAKELRSITDMGGLPEAALDDYKANLLAIQKKTIENVFRCISPVSNCIDFKALFDINVDEIEPFQPAGEEVNVYQEERGEFVDPFGYGLTAEEYRAMTGEIGGEDARTSPEKESAAGHPSPCPQINLEIGSGDGEWITAQAISSIHRGSDS